MSVAADSLTDCLIAEDVLLLVLARKAKLGHDEETKLRHAVAAALIAELVLCQRLDVEPDPGSTHPWLTPARAQPTSDGLLDLVADEVPQRRQLAETVAELASPEGEPWLEVVAARLEERGVIERRDRRRYRVRDDVTSEALRRRALESLQPGGHGDVRTNLVLRLVHATRLSSHVFGLKDRVRFDKALVDTQDELPESVRCIAEAIYVATEGVPRTRPMGATGDIHTDSGGF
jgi:hypothetical protein